MLHGCAQVRTRWLCLQGGDAGASQSLYTPSTRQNPYALEATLALTELAASKETSLAAFGSSGAGAGAADTSAPRHRDIEKFYTKLSAMASPPKFVSRVDAAWMQTLVNAHMSARRGRYRGPSACASWC